MPEVYDLKCSVCDTQLNFWETKDDDGHKLIHVHPCIKCANQEKVYVDDVPWTRDQAEQQLKLLVCELDKLAEQGAYNGKPVKGAKEEQFDSIKSRAARLEEALGY